MSSRRMNLLPRATLHSDNEQSEPTESVPYCTVLSGHFEGLGKDQATVATSYLLLLWIGHSCHFSR